MGLRLQTGDTIIEVLLSLVLLGGVIVGAITIMNRGLAAAQTAVEHSQVRLETNGQIEMLKRVRDDYIVNPNSQNGQTWNAIVAAVPAGTSLSYDQTCAINQPGADFYLAQTASRIERYAYNEVSPTLAAKAGQGLWIEAELSDGVAEPYIDFVVRACWRGPGAEVAEQRTVTAMRLYDPSR